MNSSPVGLFTPSHPFFYSSWHQPPLSLMCTIILCFKSPTSVKHPWFIFNSSTLSWGETFAPIWSLSTYPWCKSSRQAPSCHHLYTLSKSFCPCPYSSPQHVMKSCNLFITVFTMNWKSNNIEDIRRYLRNISSFPQYNCFVRLIFHLSFRWLIHAQHPRTFDLIVPRPG